MNLFLILYMLVITIVPLIIIIAGAMMALDIIDYIEGRRAKAKTNKTEQDEEPLFV